MIKRERHMSQIRPFINQTEVIKVLVGVRRSGKSIMLDLIKEELMENGVSEQQIISINFEDMNYSCLTNAQSLHTYLKEKIDVINSRVYLFLDEIQEVNEWERCINSLRVNSNVDIYITGSNATMLSGEYATLLAGRYIEIKIFPFSFSEYCIAKQNSKKSSKELLKDYILDGGLPFLATSNLDENSRMQYLKDIYSSVVIKDIMKRNKIRDIDLLERIIKYVIANVGRTFSSNSISSYLKSENRKVAPETISNYLNACKKAFLFYKVSRMNLEGKEILQINEKYYLVDHGLRQAIYGNNFRDIELILENIVCLELLRRGFDVSIGKNNTKEIDFVCQKGNQKIYIQVCYLLATEQTIEREFGIYKNIKDNYLKYVISMDDFDMSRDGIIHMNICDFLLDFDK